jgi:hypothetical protein
MMARNWKAEPSNLKICKLWCARWWLEYIHSPQYSAEVKEGVELYPYSPSGPSWLL